MLKKEKKLTSKEIFKGNLLNVYRDRVLCQNNKESTREYIKGLKASCILAINDENKIILEKQYRYPFDDYLYELPAGKCDKNEDPKITALRELEEETGYKANKIEYLGKVYPSCAYTDEIIYCYLATALVKSKQNLDDNEFIEYSFFTLDEIIKLIKEDKIHDAKTIACINYYLLRSKDS